MTLPTSSSEIEFKIVNDRQIRPCLLATCYSIQYKSYKGPVLQLISPNNPFQNLNDIVPFAPLECYFSFNGTGWARSKYFHLKLYFKPAFFVKNKLYPHWTIIKESKLETIFQNRTDHEIFSFFKSFTTEPQQIKVKYIPKGEIHGYVLSTLVDISQLVSNTIQFEQFLIQNYKNNYQIIISPFSCTKFIVGSIVDEKLFSKIHPDVKLVNSEYSFPKRLYYADFQKAQSLEFKPRKTKFNNSSKSPMPASKQSEKDEFDPATFWNT